VGVVIGRSLLLLILLLAACQTGSSLSSSASTVSSTPSASENASVSDLPSAAPLPGGRLAYGRFGPDGPHLFTANTDGTNEKALLSSSAEGPRWSPDGRHLSVVAQSPQGLLFVGLVNPDSSDYVRFNSPDPTLNLGCWAWSPDGSRLACEGWDDTDLTRNGIYTVRASDGGDLVRVTTSPDAGHDIPTDYSPDGRQIAFTRQMLPDEADVTLMVVNVDGGDARAMTDQMIGGGRWSPDGETILTDANGSLLLVPIDGSQPREIRIVADVTVTASRGSWSPDGNWIVFSRRTVGEDIYIVRKDGTNLYGVTQTPGQDEEFADWAP
jgi:Tol biopolymer transport system component